MRLTPARLMLGAGFVALVLLALLRPWVVKPLDAQGQAVVGPVAFSPEGFASKVWSEQLPAKVDAALPVARASTAAALLKGQGLVVAVDTTSRVGVARIDLDPQDGRSDVELQLGPVITGSALRDALGLAFADFDTQVDFANVSAALNRRALASSPLLATPGALKGKRIAFVGAGQVSPTGAVRLVPVRMAVVP